MGVCGGSESNSHNLVSTFLAKTLNMGGSHGYLPHMCMTSLPDLFDVPSDLCELAARRAQAHSTLGLRKEVKCYWAELGWTHFWQESST